MPDDDQLPSTHTLVPKTTTGGANSFSIPDKTVVAEAVLALYACLLANPARLLEAQYRFNHDLARLLETAGRRLNNSTLTPFIQPDPDDRRFRDSAWQGLPFDLIQQVYLLAARSILTTVRESIDTLDKHTAHKIDFYTRQYLAAMAPSNHPLLNPRVLSAAARSGGGSLLKGLSQLLGDGYLDSGGPAITMADSRAFQLGVTIATTPGKIISQTPLMQLIQYAPRTATVYTRPLLIVPPWINKYYILDLKPDNSLIRWAVEQGFSVFVISWVNPGPELADTGFDDYLKQGPLAALDAIEQATGSRSVNAVGYCLGGTLLMCTLAYLVAQNQASRVASATLLTTLVDFSEIGDLGVFIDEQQIALVEQHMDQCGYFDGRYMANAFNMLRPNELIWPFWINNYLLGKEPVAFDLLYWNADTTRMPRRMHSFYLRTMYLNNLLCNPGAVTLAGTEIDLGQIKTPLYFLSTEKDHIAPWRGTYRGARLSGGSVRFVLGGSGHIAGVINPASANKYGYRTARARPARQLPADPEQWLAKARPHAGSWWPDWLRWVKRHSGARVKAREPGDGKLRPLQNAPGSYVKMK